MYYFNFGSVRGGCGHKHRTLSGLQRCLNLELKQVRALGGGAYSDRQPYIMTDSFISEILPTECGDNNEVIVCPGEM